MAEFNDEGIILRAEDRDSSDKFVTCFTKNHGRVRFVAYGAKYQKSASGRILQPLAHLDLDLQTGTVVDRLRSCQLQTLPHQFDYKQLAYASVIAEMTEIFTADHVADENLFFLLQDALELLHQRNPRLVVLTYGIKLLAATGFAPRVDNCTICGVESSATGLMYFVSGDGVVLCDNCAKGKGMPFGSEARKLYGDLLQINLHEPGELMVRGADLMELERIFIRFVIYQTEKPLRSIAFLRQISL